MKKAKCVTIDASLVTEAEEAVARLGTTFSALVEEALRRLLRQAEAWRGVEEKLTNIEILLRRCLKETRSRRRRRGSLSSTDSAVSRAAPAVSRLRSRGRRP